MWYFQALSGKDAPIHNYFFFDGRTGEGMVESLPIKCWCEHWNISFYMCLDIFSWLLGFGLSHEARQTDCTDPTQQDEIWTLQFPCQDFFPMLIKGRHSQ